MDVSAIFTGRGGEEKGNAEIVHTGIPESAVKNFAYVEVVLTPLEGYVYNPLNPLTEVI